LATDEAAGVRARSLARLREVPVWAWLTVLVVASVALRYMLSRRAVSPWIMTDELLYSELAKSFGTSAHFAVRGQSVPPGDYSTVYPLLISPAYALFGSLEHAYAAAKAINALVMSLAAVPAYFLARRVLSARMALLAALLAIAVPSMAYVGELMTENAFYPIFLLSVLALVLMLERPTVARQLLLVAVLALAYFTRVQALALVAAAVMAPPLLVLVERAGWHALRAWRLFYAFVAVAVGVPVLIELGLGRSPRDLLGAYDAASSKPYSLGDLAHWLSLHLYELDLYLGFIPLLAFGLLLLSIRSLERPLRIYLVATLVTAAWLWLQVSAFAAGNIGRIEERNLFYLAPLFFTLLLAWIELGLPRPRVRTAVLVVVVSALPALLQYARLIGIEMKSDTLMLIPLWWISETFSLSLRSLSIVVGLVALAACALAALVSRRAWLVLPIFLLAFYSSSFVAIDSWKQGTHMASIGARWEGLGQGDPDWIDDALGPSARVSALSTASGRSFVMVWQNEFFNQSVGQVYNLTGNAAASLPEQKLRIDRRGFFHRPDGSLVRDRYLLTDRGVNVAGTVVARNKSRDIAVYELVRPLRLQDRFLALDGDGWTRARFRYQRYRCAGGSIQLQLASSTELFQQAQTVTARSGGRVVGSIRFAPDVAAVSWRVPLARRGDTCTLDFAVSPSVVPSRVIPGNTDRRRLGVRILSYRFLQRR
jgi:hypothetical protein